MSVAVAFSLAASAAYAATFVAGAFPGAWVVKAASVALLAVHARRHRLLSLALGLGATGDALLDLGPNLFVAGLLAFLAGHVAYAVCFFRHGGRLTVLPQQAGVALAAAAALGWLWPSLDGMHLTVTCYVAAIVTMVVAALRVGGWVATGALLFLVSDMLLAADRFRGPLPARDWLVWTTYYAGQLAIAVGYPRIWAQR